MKNISIVIFTIIFSPLLSFIYPPTVMAQSQVCQITNTNLEYFGYYGIISTESIDEINTMNHTNIMLTSGWGDFNKYGIFDGKFLIDMRVGMLGDENQAFYADWETAGIERLKRAVDRYDNRVYAFYIDEPYYNSISPELFREVTKKLRETFPTIGILAIEAFPPILSGEIPDNYYEYVTDLGFDYYFTHYDANNDLGWQKYMEIHTAFLPYLVGKKLWIIPDGHAPSLTVAYDRWPDAFERYVCFANSQAEAVGIMSFIYKTYPGYIELRDVINPSGSHYDQAFSQRHLETGDRIIAQHTRACPSYIDSNNKGYCLDNLNACSYYSNGCYKTITCKNPVTTCTPDRGTRDEGRPGDLNNDGSVNHVDFNELISNFGTTYTIFDFNAIVSNYGT